MEDKELPEGEGMEVEFVDHFSWKDEARQDAELAMRVYAFLEEIDTDGPRVLTWRIGGRLVRTQKDCLLIICRAIRDIK